MILSHIMPIMPRPKKILTSEEQRKKDNRLRVRAIILRLLAHIEPRKIGWIIETGIVKSWIKKYGFEFIEQFDLPNFLSETESLRPLTGDWGRKFIHQEWNRFLTFKEQNKEIELPELTENSADIIIVKTKKSLKEFLK